MGLFIMNITMLFVQINHLWKKDYKQFLIKNEIGAVRIFKFLTPFIVDFFHVFLVKVLNIISIDQNRNMLIFY